MTKKIKSIKEQLLESVKENAIIEKTDDKMAGKRKLIAYIFYPYKGKDRKQYVAETNNLSTELSVLFEKMKVLAPHYPAIENQHHSEVLLIKTLVSDLKKENFSK